MTRKAKRLTLIAIAGCILCVAAALVLTAMRDSIVFFHSPSEVLAGRIAAGVPARMGGMVEAGSLIRSADGLDIRFRVTDRVNAISVAYRGILPDLFREGQGVITEGSLDTSGVFHADTVLAKHDETYMPKAVADELKKEGHWKDDYGKTSAADSPGTVR
jgi:cytochrome c-type biogenesis protein CcmE